MEHEKDHQLFILIIQMCYLKTYVLQGLSRFLGTNLSHNTFLIQNGPPKAPPALYWHKRDSNQMC